VGWDGIRPVVFTEVRQIKEFRPWVLEVWKEKELEGDSLDLWQVKELADCGVRFTQKYNPEGFLRDLGKSEFIHVTDQYVDRESDNRYTVGQRAFVPYTPPTVPFTDNDMLAVIHAVASVTGETGYGHIYHVFLPQGQDECFEVWTGDWG
jgi:hypothetical protein